jgi:hypothetical protein
MRHELTVGANVHLVLYYRYQSQRSRRSQPNTLKKENWRPKAPNVPEGFSKWHTAMFWSNLH